MVLDTPTWGHVKKEKKGKKTIELSFFLLLFLLLNLGLWLCFSILWFEFPEAPRIIFGFVRHESYSSCYIVMLLILSCLSQRHGYAQCII